MSQVWEKIQQVEANRSVKLRKLLIGHWSRSWDNWVEVPKVPCLRQYVGEENRQVGRGLVQSLLMFAEFAMDVVTGLEAV